MDEEYVHTRLLKWFPDFKANQILSIIKSHKGKITEKEKILKKALKQIQDLDGTLKQIETQFPAVYERLDDFPRLSRMAKEGFNNQKEESLSDTIKLLENSIGVRLNSFTKSPTANSFKRSKNGERQYYITNNKGDNYQLTMELEQQWEGSTQIPISGSADNEFMTFLGLCLYGDDSKSDNAARFYNRCRAPAEHWGQKRQK